MDVFLVNHFPLDIFAFYSMKSFMETKNNPEKKQPEQNNKSEEMMNFIEKKEIQNQILKKMIVQINNQAEILPEDSSDDQTNQ